MNNDLQPQDGAPPGVPEGVDASAPPQPPGVPGEDQASTWRMLTERAEAYGIDPGPLGEGLGQLAQACGGLKLDDVRGVGGWLEAILTGPKARIIVELGDVEWEQGDPFTGPVMGPDLATAWARLSKGDDQARHDRDGVASTLAGLVSRGVGLQEAFDDAFAGQGFLSVETSQEALVGLGYTLRALAPLVPVVDAIASGAGPSAWEGLPKELRVGVAR